MKRKPTRLFQNKYRVDTTRLVNWDYSSSGWYFITICTKNRKHYFGEIENGEMNLSELGFAAACSWMAMQRVFSVLKSDVWVIMPNHIHFLFEINNPKKEFEKNEFMKMIKDSVSSIINHFKGRVTKYAIKEKLEFEWHALFHDHLVKNTDDFVRIQNYIIQNPVKWKEDSFNNNDSTDNQTSID